jgi:hypothetical protein
MVNAFIQHPSKSPLRYITGRVRPWCTWRRWKVVEEVEGGGGVDKRGGPTRRAWWDGKDLGRKKRA